MYSNAAAPSHRLQCMQEPLQSNWYPCSCQSMDCTACRTPGNQASTQIVLEAWTALHAGIRTSASLPVQAYMNLALIQNHLHARTCPEQSSIYSKSQPQMSFIATSLVSALKLSQKHGPQRTPTQFLHAAGPSHSLKFMQQLCLCVYWQTCQYTHRLQSMCCYGHATAQAYSPCYSSCLPH